MDQLAGHWMTFVVITLGVAIVLYSLIRAGKD